MFPSDEQLLKELEQMRRYRVEQQPTSGSRLGTAADACLRAAVPDGFRLTTSQGRSIWRGRFNAADVNRGRILAGARASAAQRAAKRLGW